MRRAFWLSIRGSFRCARRRRGRRPTPPPRPLCTGRRRVQAESARRRSQWRRRPFCATGGGRAADRGPCSRGASLDADRRSAPRCEPRGAVGARALRCCGGARARADAAYADAARRISDARQDRLRARHGTDAEARAVPGGPPRSARRRPRGRRWRRRRRVRRPSPSRRGTPWRISRPCGRPRRGTSRL